MVSLSPIIKELLDAIKHKQPDSPSVPLNLSGVGSSAGAFYENLRNVIDYKDEHLLRRSAIERIFKRKLLFPGGTRAENLLRELVWARYVRSDAITQYQHDQVQAAIDKFLYFKEFTNYDWLISVTSAEIDEILAPRHLEESLNRAMFRILQPVAPPTNVEKSDWEIQSFLAVRKSLFKEDIAFLRFHMLIAYIDSWRDLSEASMKQIAPRLNEISKKIESQIKNPLNTKITAFIKPYTPPFIILKSLIETSNFEELILDPDALDKAVGETCEKKYQLAKKKVGRSILRSTIYIFFTKMLLAYGLEMPADIYIYGTVRPLPLAINTIFPPVLMYLVGSSISLPGSQNTQKIKSMIKTLVYEPNPRLLPEKFGARSSSLGKLFALVYILVFMASFGLIIYVLQLLRFGVPSTILFLFFLTVVSFFAYRIRLTAKELFVIGDRRGITSAIVDSFTIPIIRVGQWFSTKFSRINIFIFILDFIIEAPFKAIIELAEEWIQFLKQKKEEII